MTEFELEWQEPIGDDVVFIKTDNRIYQVKGDDKDDAND